MREIRASISDDLFQYLGFLKKMRFIKSEEEAFETALEFYKRLAIHDWLPYVYRMGGGRVLVMDATMLADLFHELANREIFQAAKGSALKRRITNPFFRDVDLRKAENWDVVLRELEIMGWGKFSRTRDEIKVESCPLPTPYLQGYFEGMFGVSFERHPSNIPNIRVFIARKEKGVVEI